jgi:hypothetical protein
MKEVELPRFGSTHSPTPESAATHGLDIVRDCADLAGTFPRNVEFAFVHWRHADELGDDIDWLATNIAPHLLGAHTIALETGGTNAPDPNDIPEEMAIINRWIARGPSRTDGELVAAYGGKTSWKLVPVLNLLGALTKAGASHCPYFTVVDEYWCNADEKQKHLNALSELEALESAEIQAADNRRREAITLRQLNELARSLGGQASARMRIGVLYGSDHTNLSIATHALGAPTSRVFVFPPPTGRPEDYLRRGLRWADDPGEEAEIKQTAQVAERQFSRVRMASLRISNDGGKFYNQLGLHELSSGLGRLSLRLASGTLEPEASDSIASIFDAVEPYADPERRLPRFGKGKRLRDANASIIRLALKGHK